LITGWIRQDVRQVIDRLNRQSEAHLPSPYGPCQAFKCMHSSHRYLDRTIKMCDPNPIKNLWALKMSFDGNAADFVFSQSRQDLRDHLFFMVLRAVWMNSGYGLFPISANLVVVDKLFWCGEPECRARFFKVVKADNNIIKPIMGQMDLGVSCMFADCKTPAVSFDRRKKRCSHCRAIMYCSRTCQLADFERHRQFCSRKFKKSRSRDLDRFPKETR
jgi:hypothetical protein